MRLKRSRVAGSLVEQLEPPGQRLHQPDPGFPRSLKNIALGRLHEREGIDELNSTDLQGCFGIHSDQLENHCAVTTKGCSPQCRPATALLHSRVYRCLLVE